jgi:hypothetical protein
LLYTNAIAALHAAEEKIMSRSNTRNVSHSPYENGSDWRRARSILARSFYKELCSNGLGARQIVELSNELLQLVSTDVEEGKSNW